MNGTLHVLAAIAAPAADAAPANPLASLLGGVLPVLAGAVIGYVLGILRDASKAKADREARHQDQILEASAEALGAATSLAKARMGLAQTIWEMTSGRAESSAEYRALLEERRQEAFQKISTYELAAQPHLMKLAILAPKLDSAVSDLMASTGLPGNDPKAWKRNRDEHVEASIVFVAIVRMFLKLRP